MAGGPAWEGAGSSQLDREPGCGASEDEGNCNPEKGVYFGKAHEPNVHDGAWWSPRLLSLSALLLWAGVPRVGGAQGSGTWADAGHANVSSRASGG